MLAYTKCNFPLHTGDKISSCSSGIAFWVTQVGWQFLSTLILGGNICFWAKKVLEYHFWGKGHFSRAIKGIFLKLQSYVKSQKRIFWGWPITIPRCVACVFHMHTLEICCDFAEIMTKQGFSKYSNIFAVNAHSCVRPTSPLSGTSQLDSMGLGGGYFSSIGNNNQF